MIEKASTGWSKWGSANPPLAVHSLHDDRRANFASMALGKPAAWIVYSPLPPLFLMLFTGLYVLVLPVYRQMARAPNRRIKHNGHRDEDQLEENETPGSILSMRELTSYGMKTSGETV